MYKMKMMEPDTPNLEKAKIREARVWGLYEIYFQSYLGTGDFPKSGFFPHFCGAFEFASEAESYFLSCYEEMINEEANEKNS